MVSKMKLSDLLKPDSDSYIEDDCIGSRASHVNPTKIRQIYGPPIQSSQEELFPTNQQ